MSTTHSDTTDVLWTGGWDSSYRVLALLAGHGGRIQPHYVRDPERLSLEIEVETIEAIRERANRRFGERILPLRMLERVDIRVPDHVQNWFLALNKRFRLGSQYNWLSEYSLRETRGQLELCIHVDDKAHKAISWAHDHRNDREAAALVDAVDGLLLSRFRFPILEMSKLDMQRAARQGGFDDLLELTWFCHEPTRDGRPCGFCGPCTWTLEEGLGHRIPGDRRFRAGLYRWIGRHLPSWRARQAFLRGVRGTH